jgi:hypothetical protein
MKARSIRAKPFRCIFCSVELDGEDENEDGISESMMFTVTTATTAKTSAIEVVMENRRRRHLFSILQYHPVYYFQLFLFTISIMEDDFLLVILTIKALWPGSPCFSSFSCASLLDWSVLIAAFRLAAVVSAALE